MSLLRKTKRNYYVQLDNKVVTDNRKFWKAVSPLFSGKAFHKTPCLSTPAESTLEKSPVKICSVKSLPGEKRLDFLPPRQYCITYFTQGKVPHH